MISMLKRPALLLCIFVALGTASACGSDEAAAQEEAVSQESDSGLTTEPTAGTTTIPGDVGEAVDPDSIETLDQALEAMATVAADGSPEAAADFLAYFEGLSDDEQDALIAKTFGFASEQERQDFINRIQGVSQEEFVTFEVVGNEAMMKGVINSSTPHHVRQLIDAHPELTTIVMDEVPGSIDDRANLEASLLVREAGLATHVIGLVASGGVDFFLAGVERTAGPDALFGVHSWVDGAGNEGGDIPRGDPRHSRFLHYYAQVGIDSEFYWFTLEAAPADDVYFMTAAELETYGFLTAGETPTGADIANASTGDFSLTADDLTDVLTGSCLLSADERGADPDDAEVNDVCIKASQTIEAQYDLAELFEAVNGDNDALLEEITVQLEAALDTTQIGRSPTLPTSDYASSTNHPQSP